MTDTLKSPNVVNPSVLSPVHPAIEEYMRGLLSVTDHAVLNEMETLAEQNNFPIVGRLVGVFWKPWQKQLMLSGCLNLVAVMVIRHTGLPER